MTVTLNVTKLSELIAHLKRQPAVQFNMGFSAFEADPCQTAACISGHARSLWPADFSMHVADHLGLNKAQHDALFTPDDWQMESCGVERYPLWRAIRTLEHLRDEHLRTGRIVIDWGAEPDLFDRNVKSLPTAPVRAAVAAPLPSPELIEFNSGLSAQVLKLAMSERKADIFYQAQPSNGATVTEAI